MALHVTIHSPWGHREVPRSDMVSQNRIGKSRVRAPHMEVTLAPRLRLRTGGARWALRLQGMRAKKGPEQTNSWKRREVRKRQGRGWS